MKKIKLGVAGAGVFGNNHSNKIKGDSRAEFVGIFDIDGERANNLAQTHGVKGFDNLDELLALVDGIIIATPAFTHYEVANKALLAGKHCLVEKPLSTNPDDAAKLCSLADEKKLILQVGHQERYIFKAMGLIEINESPEYIESFRIGLPSVRGADVSATLDLMVHDIDLAAILIRSDATEVTSKLLSGSLEKIDAIEANIEYSNGAKAHFVASRAADVRDRRTIIKYKNGEVKIDYIARTFENTTPFALHADFAERIKDPMQAAVNDFISAILGEIPVAIPAKAGLAAVEIAQKVDALV